MSKDVMKNIIPFPTIEKIKNNPSVMFLHCLKCIDEVRDIPDISPREYVHLEIGRTEDSTLMVWCVRHEEMVCEVPFDGEFVDFQR